MSGRHSAEAIDTGAAVHPHADEPPVIVACPDGPLLVRGHIDLTTPDGEPIEQRRRTVALCRCGVSTIKPFCDGTHKAVHFRTEPVVTASQPKTDEERRSTMSDEKDRHDDDTKQEQQIIDKPSQAEGDEGDSDAG